MNLPPALWRDAAAMFDEIAVLSAEERERRLLELETSDPPLAGWLRRLLAADREAMAVGFLEAGAEPGPRPSPRAADASVGRYVLLAPIGRGGFGEVYRARDPALEREVAVKIGFARDEEEQRRFAREARIAADLVHPHICRVYDFGFDRGQPYLVEELLDGEDLSAWVERRPPAPLEVRLRWLAEALSALAWAHHRGIVHRDIKPSNLRVLANGQLKVLDFGIARRGDLSLPVSGSGSGTAAPAIVGTIAYMAPERLRGDAGEAASDVYSWGAVAWELLAGRRRLRSTSGVAQLYEALQGRTPSLGEVAPEVPQAVVAAVDRSLDPDPKRRPTDASQLAADLDRAAGGRDGAVASPSGARGSAPATPGFLSRRSPRRRAAVGLMVGLGLVVVVLLGRSSFRARAGAPAPDAPLVDPSATRGVLAIDARPWAWIEVLETAPEEEGVGAPGGGEGAVKAGDNQARDIDRELTAIVAGAATPWSRAVAAGEYRIVLRRPDGQRRECRVVVPAGGQASCSPVFERPDPQAFLDGLEDRNGSGAGERGGDEVPP